MPRKRKYSTKKKTTTKEGKRNYQRQYMRDYREQNPTVLVNKKKLKQLQNQFPDVYTLLFGKKKRKR